MIGWRFSVCFFPLFYFLKEDGYYESTKPILLSEDLSGSSVPFILPISDSFKAIPGCEWQ